LESLDVKAVISGILFGIWPLLMNRSGLSGNLSTFVFATVVFLCVFVVSFSSLQNITITSLPWAIGAGVVGALALLVFNSMLAKATPQAVGTFIVLMIITQILVPAIYQAIMNGGLPASKIAGFVLAIVAAVLLLK
jgi:hypothetical protein